MLATTDKQNLLNGNVIAEGQASLRAKRGWKARFYTT
jgi:hypothetical protein